MNKYFSFTTKCISILTLVLVLSSSLFSQNKSSLLNPVILQTQNNFGTENWRNINESLIPVSKSNRYLIPNAYRTVAFNLTNLKANLVDAPLKSQGKSKVIITLPNPDNTSSRYLVYKNTTMHPDLQAYFPGIRTYDAISIDNPGEIAKIDVTPHGFHAMILTTNGGQVFIDPYAVGDINNYIVYYKKDYNGVNRFQCDFNNTSSITERLDEEITPESFGTCELRTYRLALACTQEYAAAVGGGTQAGAMAAQVTTMNRVNGVYERDMAVTMEIIGNNNLIIYTGADPYTDNSAGALINENQTNIDALIGSGNYDIGHVFSTGGGGLAGLGVVCSNGNKARGVTGSANPQGDAYDIDYVAHEMGHQFNCNHTQNNGCNRNNATAMEPGSASSIMGYAGICAPNVQNNSDALFHGVSLQEMGTLLTSTTCAVTTPLVNVSPSATGSPGNITVPQGTPFALTLTATDPDANILTYTWEQMDNGVSTQSPVSTSTTGPNFRSIMPSTNPTRYFPNLTDLAAGGPFTWEVLPTVTRTMNFRGTVRDNSPGGGCNDHVDITVDIDGGSGPFVVTSPSATGIVWNGATSETVTWNEAGTSGGLVACANVDIYLSIDGGLTYPTLVVSNVPNNGSSIVTVPNTASTTCRIMAICADGTFFDISDNNFEIAAATLDYTLAANPTTINVCPPANGTTTINVGSIGGYNTPVTLSVTGIPAGANSAFSVNPVTPLGNSVLTISNTAAATPGSYPLVIQGISASGTKTINVTLIIADPAPSVAALTTPANGAVSFATPTNFAWNLVAGAGVIYDIDIATDAAFTSIIDNAVGLASNSYNSSALSTNTLYYWRVRAYTACGSAAFSTAFSFTTANTSCATTMSTNIPINITATGTPTVTSTITIPTNGTILDVNVISLTGTHSWINDLTITLTSPQGTSVILWSNICNNEDDFDLNFDDAAAAAGALPCPPVGGGTYQPAGSLAAFNGELSAGTWTLTIDDAFNADGGDLNSWGLEICSTPCVTPTFTQLGPYCIGDTPGTLPTTSSNAIVGTWDAAISTATANSTTYNFTPAGGCTTTASMIVVVDLCTKIDDIINNALINIYPNPTSNLITIDLKKISKVDQLTLFDARGRVAYQAENISKKMITIDMTKMSKGIYTIQSIIDGKAITHRVIKE